MQLIILPLAKKGRESKQKMIEQVVELAKQIENENIQAFVITGILEEEKQEAINLARQNGRYDANLETAESLLRDGIDVVVIMRAAGFSREQIEKIRENMLAAR